MIDRNLLLDAIDECENEPLTSSNIQRLANLYIIYNQQSIPKAEKIKTSGDSDFLRSVDGKYADDVMNIIDELVETIQLIQPALYYGLIKKIQEL